MFCYDEFIRGKQFWFFVMIILILLPIFAFATHEEQTCSGLGYKNNTQTVPWTVLVGLLVRDSYWFWSSGKEASEDRFCKEYNAWSAEKCKDSWRDSFGHSCADYWEKFLCTHDGKTLTHNLWAIIIQLFKVEKVMVGGNFPTTISTMISVSMDSQKELMVDMLIR